MRKYLSMLAMLAVVFSFMACSDDDETEQVIPVTSVKVSPETLELNRGGTGELTATVSPDNATDQEVTWSTSNPEIATVSADGVVTAVTKGNATITATAGGKTDSCEVTVTVEVESVTVSPATLTLTKLGETAQLTATIQPQDAGKATWTSSDEKVATVSEDGIVTAIAKGKATITATAGDKNSACEVTVEISIAEINGNEAILQVDGASADDVKKAIAEASAKGATRFTINGDYAATGMTYPNNPFDGVQVERLDLTGITGWPQDETGAATLPDYAFYTDSKKGIDLSNIQEVILPETVKAIGVSAFYKCSSLTRITAPGVQKINNGAFLYCSQLEEADMPAVTYIGSTGFSGSGLKTVSFPKLESVAASSFSMCKQLVEVNLPELVTVGEATSGGGGTVTGANAFADCPKLQKVYLPKVTVLGDNAFNGCTALKTIELPQAVTIGFGAFKGCTSLTTANLPQATTLYRDVFTDCKALTTLKLTAKGNISVQNTTFGAADTLTKNIDLTLNMDKKDETWDDFWKEESWKSHKWKSITLVE